MDTSLSKLVEFYLNNTIHLCRLFSFVAAFHMPTKWPSYCDRRSYVTVCIIVFVCFVLPQWSTQCPENSNKMRKKGIYLPFQTVGLRITCEKLLSPPLFLFSLYNRERKCADTIASVYFVWKIYSYFSIGWPTHGNGSMGWPSNAKIWIRSVWLLPTSLGI